jgi:4,5-dihydroxyphthalate decarboxylase
MSNLPLTFACGLYDRMLALHTREIVPDDLDLDFVAIDEPRKIFDRMVTHRAYDASEMSASEHVAMTAAGNSAFVAIPAFPSRVFRHSFIFVNAKRISRPKDLEGKRVGVPLYTMTAALYIRGLLEDEYGVDLSGIRWVQGAINHPGTHGDLKALPLLKAVSIEQNTSGKSLSDLLDIGALDAIIGTAVPDSIVHNPAIRRLIPDFRAVEQDYYRRTKIFPIMHLVVIRRDVHERYPFVARSLYRALNAAKDHALAKMRPLGTLRYMLPWMTADLDEIDAVFGGDPWPYGVEPNRPTLEALVRYMVSQGLISRPIPVDELFVPVA